MTENSTETTAETVSKVVSLKTRKPIEQNADNVTKSVESEIDKDIPVANKDIEEALNVAMQMNNDGRLTNIIFIAWDHVSNRWQRAIVIPTDDLANEALRVNGAIDLIKNDMIEISKQFSDYMAHGE